MPAPGSAKAPDMNAVEFGNKEDGRRRKERSDPVSRLHIWKQVLIAELLNLLERRRYDAPGTK